MRSFAPVAGGLLAAVLLLASLPATSSFSDPGLDGPVYALMAWNGKLVVGGRFTSAGGVAANNVAIWDDTGWHALGAGITGDRIGYECDVHTPVLVPAIVYALAVYGGELVAGGIFSVAGEDTAWSVARWDGAAWRPLGGGMGGTFFYASMVLESCWAAPYVQSLSAVGADLYALGGFEETGDVAAHGIARWDGSAWSALGGGLQWTFFDGIFLYTWPRPIPGVDALAAWGDKLVAAGAFFQASDLPAPGLALWDGASWGLFFPDPAPFLPDPPAHRTGILAAGDGLYIAGVCILPIPDVGDFPWYYIEQWDGAAWIDLGWPMAQATPSCLAKVGDDLFAGGYRLAGSAWVNELQTDGAVKALVDYNGRLVAAGDFTSALDRPVGHIVAWPDEPTSVWLKSFTASREGDRARVRWTIVDADGVDGLQLWRQAEGGGREPVAESVPLEAGDQEFLDAAAPAAATAYWLGAVEAYGALIWYGPARLAALTVPRAPRVTGVYPNPFNPGAVIRFALPRTGIARLTVHDARGRRVAVLCEETLAAGEHERRWDGRGTDGAAVPSGVYFARVTAEGRSHALKLVLAR